MTVLGSETRENDRPEETASRKTIGRRLRNLLMMLGGANLKILREAPADENEFVSRGLIALVPALLAAAGFTIAGVVITYTLWAGAPMGVVWGLIVLIVDVGLMTALVVANKRQKRKAVIIRSVVAIIMAYITAQFIQLGVYHHDIQPEMVRMQYEAAQETATNVVGPQYKPDFDKYQKVLDEGTKALNDAAVKTADLTQQRDAAKINADCELLGVADGNRGCKGTTGNPGMGREARLAQSQLETIEGQLATAKAEQTALQAQLEGPMNDARANLTRIQANIDTDKAAALNRELEDKGLIRQWEALDRILDRSPAAWWLSHAIEAAIFVIDLMAIFTAVTGETVSYTLVVEAMAAEAAVRSAIRKARAERALTLHKSQHSDEVTRAAISNMADEDRLAEEGHQYALDALDRQREMTEARGRIAMMEICINGDVKKAKNGDDVTSAIKDHDVRSSDHAPSRRATRKAATRSNHADPAEATTEPMSSDPDDGTDSDDTTVRPFGRAFRR